ncbi:MAG: hypothetical protein ACI9S9_001619, partial [Planctomycetota bacterium]
SAPSRTARTALHFAIDRRQQVVNNEAPGCNAMRMRGSARAGAYGSKYRLVIPLA